LSPFSCLSVVLCLEEAGGGKDEDDDGPTVNPGGDIVGGRLGPTARFKSLCLKQRVKVKSTNAQIQMTTL
jgi:hypothetical protein